MSCCLSVVYGQTSPYSEYLRPVTTHGGSLGHTARQSQARYGLFASSTIDTHTHTHVHTENANLRLRCENTETRNNRHLTTYNKQRGRYLLLCVVHALPAAAAPAPATALVAPLRIEPPTPTTQQCRPRLSATRPTQSPQAATLAVRVRCAVAGCYVYVSAYACVAPTAAGGSTCPADHLCDRRSLCTYVATSVRRRRRPAVERSMMLINGAQGRHTHTTDIAKTSAHTCVSTEQRQSADANHKAVLVQVIVSTRWRIGLCVEHSELKHKSQPLQHHPYKASHNKKNVRNWQNNANIGRVKGDHSLHESFNFGKAMSHHEQQLHCCLKAGKRMIRHSYQETKRKQRQRKYVRYRMLF